MDVREFVAANAAEFSQALRDLSRRLRGAESAAYLWEELAAAGAAAR